MPKPRDFNDCAPIPDQSIPVPPSGALKPGGSAIVQGQACGPIVDDTEDSSDFTDTIYPG